MELWAKIGFSEGEGKVYEAILRSELPTLQSIHEYTGIERRNVYDILNKLISKGLVAYYTENKRKLYRITHPNKILAYLEEKERALGEEKKTLLDEMPRLVRQYEGTKEEITADIYRGNEGMKALFEDMLNYKDHYFVGGNWGVIKFIGKNFWWHWNAKREEKGIWWHDILTEKTFVRGAPPEGKAHRKLQFYEFKVLPPEFNSPHVILIFGNKVANIIWSERSFAFVITNDNVAKSYIDYFKYLWGVLPVPKK